MTEQKLDALSLADVCEAEILQTINRATLIKNTAQELRRLHHENSSIKKEVELLELITKCTQFSLETQEENRNLIFKGIDMIRQERDALLEVFVLSQVFIQDQKFPMKDANHPFQKLKSAIDCFYKIRKENAKSIPEGKHQFIDGLFAKAKDVNNAQPS